MGDAAVLTFHGGVGTVTGSKTLLTHAGRRLLVDCGMYQGAREWRRQNWQPFPVPPHAVDEVVVTHCHLDHCGMLPVLVRDGFDGPVRMTPWTADLAAIVLRDSAHLHEREAEQARAGGWSRHDPPLPLYTVADAERAVERFRPAGYDVPLELGGGLEVVLSRAGHVLGSASVLVRAGDASVLFSGDLGRPTHPVLRARAAPPAARTVVLESTYGDRTHPTDDVAHAELADAIRRTVDRGGSVLVAAFAVDRTPLVLRTLTGMLDAGRIPRVPVYVDSPMALRALDVYRRAAADGELTVDVGSIGGHPAVHEVPGPEGSRELNDPLRPCVVVSASGMASGGRVVHHLERMLPDRRHTVVLTGFQAPGTRGRALVEGAREVKVHGRYVRVRAEVVQDEGFSVHADAGELVDWLRAMPEPPRTVHVVHGEPAAAAALAERVRDALDCAVSVPRPGERVRLD